MCVCVLQLRCVHTHTSMQRGITRVYIMAADHRSHCAMAAAAAHYPRNPICGDSARNVSHTDIMKCWEADRWGGWEISAAQHIIVSIINMAPSCFCQCGGGQGGEHTGGARATRWKVGSTVSMVTGESANPSQLTSLQSSEPKVAQLHTPGG